jgi:hypothetical protein
VFINLQKLLPCCNFFVLGCPLLSGIAKCVLDTKSLNNLLTKKGLFLKKVYFEKI